MLTRCNEHVLIVDGLRVFCSWKTDKSD